MEEAMTPKADQPHIAVVWHWITDHLLPWIIGTSFGNFAAAVALGITAWQLAANARHRRQEQAALIAAWCPQTFGDSPRDLGLNPPPHLYVRNASDLPIHEVRVELKWTAGYESSPAGSTRIQQVPIMLPPGPEPLEIDIQDRSEPHLSQGPDSDNQKVDVRMTFRDYNNLYWERTWAGTLKYHGKKPPKPEVDG